MRSLFVMDPLSSIRVDTDSTWLLMSESQRRGWPVYVCEPGDLFLDGEVRARVRALRCHPEPPHFHPGIVEDLPLSGFELIWMRKDPPFDMAYVFATWLLDLAARSTTVLNDPAWLKIANEKLYPLRWPRLVPETVLGSSLSLIRATVERMGRAVLKPYDGCGGRGVVLTFHGDPNLPAIAELLTGEGRRAILVQQYLPQVEEGDKRIILVDGEVGGQVNRIPRCGDHRCNIHVGARVEKCALTDRDREICAAIGPELKRNGLLFVGVDVIGGYLTEINVTSPTGLQEINRFMGLRLEADLLDAAARHVAVRHGGSV